MLIVACLEWADRCSSVDPLTGEVQVDERTSGMSLADAAALEWALRYGATCGGDVIAVTFGPAGADSVLRDALTVGAARAVRVAGDRDASAADVAAGLAIAVVDADVIWCGDQGVDGGSGAVPAFLAEYLGRAAALGLVEVAIDDGARTARLSGVRRLDGGRRERLRITPPAVLSVEGATARLRRGTLTATMAAGTAPIETIAPSAPSVWSAGARTTVVERGPYRPRPRQLDAPAGATARERICELTGVASAAHAGARPVAIALEPAAAAERILAAMADWGYEWQ